MWSHKGYFKDPLDIKKGCNFPSLIEMTKASARPTHGKIHLSSTPRKFTHAQENTYFIHHPVKMIARIRIAYQTSADAIQRTEVF